MPGTACYVRGGPRILDSVERNLNIKAGETTIDKNFSLETVNCLGLLRPCPVVEIDGQYHGKLSPQASGNSYPNTNEVSSMVRLNSPADLENSEANS